MVADVTGPIEAMRTAERVSVPTAATRLSAAEELVKVTQSGNGCGRKNQLCLSGGFLRARYCDTLPPHRRGRRDYGGHGELRPGSLPRPEEECAGLQVHQTVELPLTIRRRTAPASHRLASRVAERHHESRCPPRQWGARGSLPCRQMTSQRGNGIGAAENDPVILVNFRAARRSGLRSAGGAISIMGSRMTPAPASRKRLRQFLRLMCGARDHDATPGKPAHVPAALTASRISAAPFERSCDARFLPTCSGWSTGPLASPRTTLVPSGEATTATQ